MALLFGTLGISNDEFLLLNAIWAIVIVLLEVPSGAMADLLGRKLLLQFSGVLFIVEIGLLLLIPFFPAFAFWLCLGNRLLSGLSEAMTSGADQAITYDSLQASGREDEWEGVLGKNVKVRSIGFSLILLLGGFLYDSDTINALLEPWGFSLGNTRMYPLILCLIQAVICLYLANRMIEPETATTTTAGAKKSGDRVSVMDAGRQVFQVLKWLLKHPVGIRIIAGGVMLDSVARVYTTLNSEYNQAIGFPVWSFGLIGLGTGVLGFYSPYLMKQLGLWVKNPLREFVVLGLLQLLILVFLIQGIPYWGAIFGVLMIMNLGWADFIMSKYLNVILSKEMRATALSVKGLAINLGYAVMGWVVASLIAQKESSAGFMEKIESLPYLFGGIILFYCLVTYQKLLSTNLITKKDQ